MAGGIIEHALLRAKARTGAGSNTIVWLAVAGLLALIAVVFLTVAFYAWLAAMYGSAVAALDVGLLYAVLAAVAIGFSVRARRLNRVEASRRIALAGSSQSHAWPLDPRLLGFGLEAARLIGWRRLVPLAIAGVGIAAAVATGRGLQKSAEDTQHERERT